MQLDQLLANAAQQVGQPQTISIPEGWGQGRAVFGGLVAGLMIARAEPLVNDAAKTLRSAFISFVGPVATGEAELQAQVLRTGKSVTTIQVLLIQQGQVQAVLVASFGAARESIINIQGEHTAPIYKAPEQCQALPFIPGITPAFLQHFDALWAEGALPFSGAKQPDFGGWMRFKDHANISSIQLPHLLVLDDMWPPAVLPMYDRIAPSSSLNWNFELITMPEQTSAASWWQYQVKTDYAADGYAYTQAKIWDEQGNLVALSRQTVTVFI
ncbi:thioesterase family protein [Alkanindiges sp. WGS2144]|uniref:thioesterase family protein n=1 Tax=Alkanindiges sp. WGS2144 TaxID=3366808 RepID=UPI0037514EDC